MSVQRELVATSACIRCLNHGTVVVEGERVIVDDSATSSALFQRLESHLPQRLGAFRLAGLNERLRFYRYAPTQRFLAHMDHWYRPSARRVTLLTVLVYFNDNFSGGETCFSEQLERTVVPSPGLVAIFQHKMRHEGCEVRSGLKYAMRTDVIFEAPDDIAMPGFDEAG